MEAECLEVAGQAGLVEVAGDDLRAGRERRLDIWRDIETALDRLFREQAGAEHDRRIRGVCAARDRRDHDRAVPNVRDRLAHLDRYARQGGVVPFALGKRSAYAARKVDLTFSSSIAVLRAARTSHARLDRAEIELQRRVVDRIGRLVRPEQPLLLAVALDEVDLSRCVRPVMRR